MFRERSKLAFPWRLQNDAIEEFFYNSQENIFKKLDVLNVKGWKYVGAEPVVVLYASISVLNWLPVAARIQCKETEV